MPTPTAAAELAAPERTMLWRRLTANHNALHRQTRHHLELRAQQLDHLAERLVHPAKRLAAQGEQLRDLRRRLDASLLALCANRRRALVGLNRRLRLSPPRTADHTRQLLGWRERLSAGWRRRQDAGQAHLNPHAVLARGYGIVTDAQGRIVRDSHALTENERIHVRLHHGELSARVETVNSLQK